jgi:hypothetical protein
LFRIYSLSNLILEINFLDLMPALSAKRFFLLLVVPLVTLSYCAGASVSLTDLVNNLLAYALAREYDPLLLGLTLLSAISLLLLPWWLYRGSRKATPPPPEILQPSDGKAIQAQNQERIAHLEELLRENPSPAPKAAAKPALDEGLDMSL